MKRLNRTRLDDPTAEHTSDTSTPSASGLGGGRTPPAEERNRQAETPRRYEQPTDEDPVMPSEDPSLNTKI